MLSLTRKTNEWLAIGIMPNVEIRIHIVRIQGNTVQLAIDCPKEFPILRQELYVNADGFKPEDFGEQVR